MRLTTRIAATQANTLSRQSDRIARVVAAAAAQRSPAPVALSTVDLGPTPDPAETVRVPNRDAATSASHTVFIRGGG